MADTLCYDIEGNIAPCSDVAASGIAAQPLTTTDLQNLYATGGALDVSGPGGTAAIVGLGTGGGNVSSIGAQAPDSTASITKAIQSVFGTVYGAIHPAKPGQVINPATGQPYSLQQQLQLSGLFSNPLVLILIILAAVFAFRGNR